MSTAALIRAPDSPAGEAARSRAGLWLLAATLGLAWGVSAWWQLFTTFRFWDDEGYVLIALRNFAAGGALYREVFSQYGPFYNSLFGFAHNALGLPLDSFGARWTVCILWTASALLSAALVFRMTKSWTWSVAGGTAAFVLLRLLTHEPLHPVGLIALLLTAGTCMAVGDVAEGRDTRAAAVIGITGGLLAMIKVNVGVFYLAGGGVFLLWSTANSLSRPGVRALLVIAALLGGVALMRPLIAADWVRTFVLVYSVAAATTLTVLATRLTAFRPAGSLVVPGVATLVTIALVLGVAIGIHGMAPAQLVDGIIVGPLHHPASFSYPFRWSGLTHAVLLCNAGAFLGWLGLRRKRPQIADALVAGCRAVVGAGFFVSYFHSFAVSIEGYLLSFGAGFLWSLAASFTSTPPPEQRARQLLAVLSLFQILHAFPVAGTQVNIGTLLLGLLIVIALADAARWCGTTFPRARSGIFTRVAAGLALGLALWGFGRLTLEAARAYRGRSAESFSGARLHLSAWQSSALHTLVANARWHGDLLFSMPGMFSFNLWTGLPTPSKANVTRWWTLLDESQQSAIAARLTQAARPVVIVQRNLLTTGLHRFDAGPGPLTRVLDRDFTKLFALDSYEFWVRRGSEVRAIDVAQWSERDRAPVFSFASPRADLASAHHVEFHHYARDLDELVATTRTTLSPSGADAGRGLGDWSCTLPPGFAIARERCDAARLFDARETLLAEIRFPRPEPQENPE